MRSDRSDLAGLFRLFSKPLYVNLVVGTIGAQGLQGLVDFWRQAAVFLHRKAILLWQNAVRLTSGFDLAITRRLHVVKDIRRIMNDGIEITGLQVKVSG